MVRLRTALGAQLTRSLFAYISLFFSGLALCKRFAFCARGRGKSRRKEEVAEWCAGTRGDHHDPEHPAPAEGTSRDAAEIK